MEKYINKLIDAFDGYINSKNEVILNHKSNLFISLNDIDSELKLKAKVLSECSRDAFISEPFETDKFNEMYHIDIRYNINQYLDTNFDANDFELIYNAFGNGANKKACYEFICNGYDMEIINNVLNNKPRKVYAIDFDGTLCEENFPGIGNPNQKMIDYVIDLKKQGNYLILYTMREDGPLNEALEFCKIHGIPFDAVNDNLKWLKEYYGNNSRKVYADYYIDDHSLFVQMIKDAQSNIKNALDVSDHKYDTAAAGYDQGWYAGEGNAYSACLDLLNKIDLF